jgi:hypothetical protein
MALLRLIITAAVGWCCATSAPAEEPHAGAVPIRFVPATGSGTVSLGIYDREGLLVRVLCDEWPFSRFRVGLNGLSTTWDGKDNDGQAVPEGIYTARGFVVGDVAISGEAFHFNDWIESDDSPRIVSVAGAQLLPGGDVLLMARLAGDQGALVRYSPESEARWRTMVAEPRPEAAKQAQLAFSEKTAFVLLDGKIRSAGLEDGAETPVPVSADGVVAIAARGDRLALLGNGSLRFFLLPDFASQGEEKNLPAPLVSIALLDQGAIASAEDGSVWRWQAGWSPVEMPPGTKVRAVSAGRDNTFWVLEENADGSTSAAHYNPDEGRLAEWSPGADAGRITEVAGTTEKDYFVASLTAPDIRRTVGIRRKSEGEGWEYVFDKKITRSAEFGWKDGQLSATGGETPQEIAARLIVNPLDPGASRDLMLHAATNVAGPLLQTGDGLPLLRISSGAGYRRVMVVAGPNENTARFFQGDGSCVEEYALSGLGNMTSFDAGTIKMTGGAEATPQVVEEPQPAAP